MGEWGGAVKFSPGTGKGNPGGETPISREEQGMARGPGYLAEQIILVVSEY